MKYHETPFSVTPETEKLMELKYKLLMTSRDLGLDVDANMSFETLFTELMNSGHSVHIHVNANNKQSEQASEEYCEQSPTHEHSAGWFVYEQCQYCGKID